jgi:transposase-like protein
MLQYASSIAPLARAAGTLRVGDIARRYGINPSVVHYWSQIGVIAAQKRKPDIPYAITITNDAARELRERIANSSRIKPSFQNAAARDAV